MGSPGLGFSGHFSGLPDSETETQCSAERKPPLTKHQKPHGEQLLDQIDKNPNDREAWNELAGEAPTKVAKKKNPTRQALAGRAKREHGTLTVIPTAGAIENINRLTAGRGHCPEMFALIQDGTPVPADVGLELLGRLPQPEIPLRNLAIR
jgi:hypothetical protein